MSSRSRSRSPSPTAQRTNSPKPAPRQSRSGSRTRTNDDEVKRYLQTLKKKTESASWSNAEADVVKNIWKRASGYPQGTTFLDAFHAEFLTEMPRMPKNPGLILTLLIKLFGAKAPGQADRQKSKMQAATVAQAQVAADDTANAAYWRARFDLLVDVLRATTMPEFTPPTVDEVIKDTPASTLSRFQNTKPVDVSNALRKWETEDDALSKKRPRTAR